MGVHTYIHTYTTLLPPPPILNLLSPSSSPNPKPKKTLVTRNKKNPPLILITKNRRQVLFLISLLPSCSSALAGGFDFVSPKEREASVVVTRRVDEAVELLEKGREFQAQGDFTQALLLFTQRLMQGSVVRKSDGKENVVLRSMVIERYKDLALSDYARVGRALALYEVGNRDDSIAEMEDVSISLKGYPEVHAALAAALYVDKHSPLLAENQFTIATLLDPRYTDISFVTKTKHWPPSLEKKRKRVTLR